MLKQSSNRGLEIRAARPSDALGIARVHVDSSAEAYAPLARRWPEHEYELERRLAMWQRQLALGAENEGAALFVACLPPLPVDSGGRSPLQASLGDPPPAGEIVGFVEAGRARRADSGAKAEVFVIHVAPAYRGQRTGHALWLAAAERVRGQALASMYVDTLAELRCCSFYEKHGGRRVQERPIEYHGAERRRVTYLWLDGHGHGATGI